jgi:hypothetical protein
MSTHAHGAHCACAHHAVAAPSTSSTLSALLPALSCAVCPACLALWKPLLSVVGVTLALNDAQHAWLLFASLAVSVAVAVWDVRRARVWLPFWLTLAGAALMVLSHALGDVATLEWLGVAVMVSSVPARMVLRARHRHAIAS